MTWMPPNASMRRIESQERRRGQWFKGNRGGGDRKPGWKKRKRDSDVAEGSAIASIGTVSASQLRGRLRFPSRLWHAGFINTVEVSHFFSGQRLESCS